MAEAAVPLSRIQPTNLSSTRVDGQKLFLTGFLVLFLELASIRWFAATVVFLQFFTNIILLASFLGMSCGCLAARRRRNWLEAFPVLAFGAVLAAFALLATYTYWAGFAIDVGHQASPQEIFFGTEYRNPDVARFAVPIELVAGLFFVLIALMFVGLGQVLGRAFDAYPDRILGYTLNIGGSLLGIVLFSFFSLAQTAPWLWFAVCCGGVAYLLHLTGALTRPRVVTLIGVVAVITIHGLSWKPHGARLFWSPYYAVESGDLHIWVNRIGHQAITPFDSGGSPYSLIHLLERAAGGEPFGDVLIIGAGSGNDVDHALRYGAGHIDAVEIDPVIQRIGMTENPDRPYADPRVTPQLDDGRHYLRTTDRKYDLIVYALVDSLILHSGYANIRLESYLFTEQAFDDIKRALKPGGVFVTYNFFRQGWVVERVAAMAKRAFGCEPTVLTLPYEDAVLSSRPIGFAMVIGGCNQRISKAFAAHGDFWLNELPPRNMGVDGFAVRPETLPAAERSDWLRIAPARLVHDLGTPRPATDDWPFLYLEDRLIPGLTIRSMALLGSIGVGMVYLFLPKGEGRLNINGRMFFLGAAFMLLETKAVVQLALLFGSTWIVNSAVFFTVLILILLANLFVLKAPPSRIGWHYAGLLALLTIAIAVPLGAFLSGGVLMRYVVPCALALGPMFFGGVIFAKSFRDSPDPGTAFGSNIAGSMVGGLSESFSMLLGFRYLLLLAIAFYLLSAVFPVRTAGLLKA
jgi:SAM-dependent methyltransferase